MSPQGGQSENRGLEAARTAQREMRREELEASTDPKHNGAKIRAIEAGTLDWADLYRTATAGPSGQRAQVLAGRVRYTPDALYGEFRVSDRDGSTAGWVTREMRNGEVRYAAKQEDYDGGVSLLGWADTLSHAADVLVNGENAASTSAARNSSGKRISGNLFERNPARSKTVDDLDRELAAREERIAQERAARQTLDMPRDKADSGGASNTPTTEAPMDDIARHTAAPVSINVFENGAGQVDIDGAVYDMYRQDGKWHADPLEGEGKGSFTASTVPDLARKLADAHGVSGRVSIEDERETGKSLTQAFEHAAKAPKATPATPGGEPTLGVTETAKGRTTTVTLPDGTTAQRTSKTMAYTHAIVLAVDARAEARDKRAKAEEYDQEAARYEAEGNASYATWARGIAAARRAEADALDAGPAVQYFVPRWSQSLQNAYAGRSAFRGYPNLIRMQVIGVGGEAKEVDKPAKAGPTAEERAAAKEARKQAEKERVAASNEAWFARTQEEIREAIRRGDDPERVMQFTTEKALTWLTTKLKAKLPRSASERTRDVRRKAIVEAVRAQMAQDAATPTPADRAPDTRTPERPATDMGNVDTAAPKLPERSRNALTTIVSSPSGWNPGRMEMIRAADDLVARGLAEQRRGRYFPTDAGRQVATDVNAEANQPQARPAIQWRRNNTGTPVLSEPSQTDIVRGDVVLTDPDQLADKLRRAGSREAAMAILERYQGGALRRILATEWAKTPSPLGNPSLSGMSVAELRRRVYELLYGREADGDAISRAGSQRPKA